jgi:beta-ureidopropionase / N-carbamoyl-L-amino-acid hydrolase
MKKQKLLINGERLSKTLEKFADFGRTVNNGVTRLSLTEEDRLVRDYFCYCCEELGMTIKVDDLGNIYATLAGIEDKPPIVMGSQMDTVN